MKKLNKFLKLSWYTEQQAISRLEPGSIFYPKVELNIIALISW